MGADDHILSNSFLPLGKVRMGYPTGENEWGLMSVESDIQQNRVSITINKYQSSKLMQSPGISLGLFMKC